MKAREDVRNEEVEVGTTSTTVAYARPENDPRHFIIITNASTGGQVVYYALGNVQATTSHQPLNPTDSICLTADAYSPCWQGAIQVIADGAGAKVRITEW